MTCWTRCSYWAASTVDHGRGIPEADRERLFTAFHRAGNVGQTPGTGLGLVIVKRCVECHGGTLELESKEGQGTLFTVVLPILRSSPA
ncbi:MAG: sensor histidine kinase [Verrucomicrobia bacterium]|nr:sensor histidine kinase [Verrucomicrobiota bacterium]